MAEKFADTPLLSKRFDNAMQLALDHHRVHLRKDTLVPYVAHLLAVTSIVLELGGDEDEAIAALLHDAVEDGGGPMMQKRIAWEFGPGVAAIVKANTDTDIEPKGWSSAYLADVPNRNRALFEVDADILAGTLAYEPFESGTGQPACFSGSESNAC